MKHALLFYSTRKLFWSSRFFGCLSRLILFALIDDCKLPVGMDSTKISLPHSEGGDRLKERKASLAGTVVDWDKWEEKEDAIESEGQALR